MLFRQKILLQPGTVREEIDRERSGQMDYTLTWRGGAGVGVHKIFDSTGAHYSAARSVSGRTQNNNFFFG